MRLFPHSKLAGVLIAAVTGFSALMPVASHAAPQFERMVRIIVPFAPGGTSDILARIIGPKLSAAIGQTVIVENKPGAAGNIGADAVAKSPTDGHTLLLIDVGTLATSPSLFNNLTYDIEKDLAPVGMVMFAPYVLATHPSLGVKSVDELMKHSAANPGKVTVANSGIGAGNHLAALAIDLQDRFAKVQVHAAGGVEVVLAQGQGFGTATAKVLGQVHSVVGALALLAEHPYLELLQGAAADQLFDTVVADHAVADDDQSLSLPAAHCCLHKPILDQKKSAWSRSSRRLCLYSSR